MRIRDFLFALILTIPGVASAQCPLFVAPDSVCAGVPFTVVNSSPPGSTFEWDLNPGEMLNPSTGGSIAGLPLNFPQQMRVVDDAGNKHLFVANYGGGNFLRFDFGTSYSNTPLVHNYGNPGGLLNQPFALDIVKDNGQWYAFVGNYGNNNLIRIDLGNNITANSATAVNLSALGMNKPKNIRIIKDGANFHCFAACEQGNTVVRIDFGTSITNLTPSSTPFSIPNFVFGFGIDLAYDCSINKFIGFASSSSGAFIQILDFGTSLANIPTPLGTFPTLNIPRSVQLLNDGRNWHLLVITGANNRLQNFRLSQNLLGTPTLVFEDSFGSMSNPTSITVAKDSSVYYGFSGSASSALLTTFNWPNNPINTPVVSNDPDSIVVISNGGGYQKIMLKAIDANGTASYFIDSVFVNPKPQILFGSGSGCEGVPVQFTDSSTITSGSITSWNWNFGDNTTPSLLQNPDHSYTGTGTFTVTLTATSGAGCSGTDSSTVVIYENPTADFSFINNQCENYIVPFTDLSLPGSGTNITDWLWDFGDGSQTQSGSSQSHQYTDPGVYSIKLITSSDVGCVDSLIKDITIIPGPEASFTVSSTCVNDSAVFNNTTTISGGGTLSYIWDFGDSNSSILDNPVHQYPPTAANYDVMMIATASNNCKDTVITNIRIANRPVPIFNFNPPVICEGNAVTFTNLSTGSGGDTISAYFWDFGDLNSSILENPIHAYADTGYYNVTLTATSPTNCDSSITQQVYVIPSPTATFTATSVCLTLTTSFSPFIATPPGTTVDSIVWDFGDGATFTGLTSPSHTYSAPGSYAVTMIVYNNLLCTGTYIDSVVVHPLPTADFSNSLACSGSEIEFDGNLSQVTGDSITAWLWNFDGLGSSNDTMPVFEFANAGIYDVTLIVTTSNGCTDTVQNQVSVIQSPDFYFTYAEPCFGTSTSFTYVSNITPVPPSNLIWDFGDGSLSSLLSPSHFYNSDGTYNISLTVTNPNTGCTTTNDSIINVHPLPVPGFVSPDACEDAPRIFTDTSSVTSGNIIVWNWNFGSLGTSTDQNPVINPTTAGIYTATLKVETDKGCEATISSGFEVYARPSASFQTDPLFGSPPLLVNFINNTTGGTTYSWDFGDGNTGTGSAPSHSYADTGLYQITMYAFSPEGCADTSYGTVSVLIPYLDIAVLEVFSVTNNGKVKLIARLANQGNITINDVTLRGQIQNATLINESWEGALLPGQLILYEFVSSYEMPSDYKPEYFCIEAVDPNGETDQNLSNNSKCAVLSTDFNLLGVFPSPFTNQLNINLSLPGPILYSISIYDATGKMVLMDEGNRGLEGFNTHTLNTSSLAKGLYSIIVRSGDDVRSVKAIKQ